MKYTLRPLSPHLVIYKTQITSLFSIFHRISGALNIFVFSFLILYFYFFLYFFGFSSFLLLFYDLHHSFIIFYTSFIVFFSVTFFFHIFNGVRHLSWDFCIGLKLKDLLYSSALILIVISFICFLLFSF